MQLSKKNTREPGYPDPGPGADEFEPTATESYYTDLPPTATRTRAPGADNVPASARGESVVDGHSTFDGKYETDQDLRVEGTISGEVICRGELTVERDATATAKIQARDATIRGRVDGEVVCGGRLLLTGTAVVTGTLKAATLVVEEGATLRGSVETVQDTPVTLPRASRVTAAPADVTAAAVEEPPQRGSAAVSSLPARNGSRSREVPSFALVSSDERGDSDRN